MKPLTAERLWQIPRVGAPHAVAGGLLLVPVTTYGDDDSAMTTLWRVDASNGHAEFFAQGTISGLSLSADKKTAAYLKEAGDHRQVYIQSLAGGEGRQIGDLPLGAVGVHWAPDGRLVALATLWREHPTLEGSRDYEPPPHLRVHATEVAVFQYWDDWLEHVYHPVLLDPSDGSATDLTPGATRFWRWPATEDSISDLDVSPDGSLLVFSADDSAPPHRELSWSLFLLPTEGGDPTRLDLDLPGHSRRPRFTRDGKGIVYGYQRDADYYACPPELMRFDLESGEHRGLGGPEDRSPSGWINESADTILFTVEDDGRNKLWRLSLGDGECRPLTESGWVSDPTIDDEGTIYLLAHDLSSPPDIHRLTQTGTERITRFASDALAGIDLGAVRKIQVKGADQSSVQVWLVDPPDAPAEQLLPLVHMLHGGPHAASGDGWHWRWNAQVVAAAGFRVAMVNFHGSTGWGDDFTRSIHGAWGDLPLRDVEAVTDHLVSAGLAEPDRIAITGGSYGGYLVSWIAANTDRYACVVAHAAVTDLAGMYASDLTYGRARAYGAEVWEDPDTLQRWSPALNTAKYATPTLVIHGSRDRRVPLTQGTELYGVLVGKGVPARLLVYPTENHWILSRANSIHWYDEVISWLKRWV